MFHPDHIKRSIHKMCLVYERLLMYTVNKNPPHPVKLSNMFTHLIKHIKRTAMRIMCWKLYGFAITWNSLQFTYLFCLWNLKNAIQKEEKKIYVYFIFCRYVYHYLPLSAYSSGCALNSFLAIYFSSLDWFRWRYIHKYWNSFVWCMM